MKKFRFKFDNQDDLVLVDAIINGYQIKLALDTAATHTVIDSTALMIAGIDCDLITENVKIETASGIIEASKILISSFASLDKLKLNFNVTSYDFMKYGLLTEIDGVLGLDFFRNSVLTIDFVKKELSLK